MARARAVRIGTLVLIAALSWVTRQVRVSAMQQYSNGQHYEDVYYLPPAEWLSVFSLGHREALADLIWMRALLYIGAEFKDGGDVENVFRYAEALVTVDPEFKRAYRWVGTAGLYRPQAITAEDAQRTVEFLDQAVRKWPDDGQLNWELGATLAYELVPLLEDEDAQHQARERATQYLMVAVRQGEAPDWLTLNNATQLEQLGQNERAAQHLEEMYPTISDPAIREEIEGRIARLRGQAEAEALRAASRRFLEDHERDFPWIPPSLYQVVGSRPPVQPTPDFE